MLEELFIVDIINNILSYSFVVPYNTFIQEAIKRGKRGILAGNDTMFSSLKAPWHLHDKGDTKRSPVGLCVKYVHVCQGVAGILKNLAWHAYM